jgi:hypothetical protein
MGQVVEHDSNHDPWDDKQVKHLVSVEKLNNKYCYEFK